jgi:hypothetical protein
MFRFRISFLPVRIACVSKTPNEEMLGVLWRMYLSNKEIMTMKITLIIGFLYLRAWQQKIPNNRQALEIYTN